MRDPRPYISIVGIALFLPVVTFACGSTVTPSSIFALSGLALVIVIEGWVFWRLSPSRDLKSTLRIARVHTEGWPIVLFGVPIALFVSASIIFVLQTFL